MKRPAGLREERRLGEPAVMRGGGVSRDPGGRCVGGGASRHLGGRCGEGRGQCARSKMAAASAAGPPTNVFPFRDARAAPDQVLEAGPVAHGALPVPLVLDNGSFQARAGWACPGPDPGPEPRLQFRAVCARGRGGARGAAGPQVGNALGSLEPLRWMLRSPFDRNVPVNLELQELLLDYSFQHLGVSSQVKGVVGLGLRGGVRSCPRSQRSPRDNSHSSSSECHLVIDLVSRSNIRRLTCVKSCARRLGYGSEQKQRPFLLEHIFGLVC